jgi:Ca-activated chloride channel family protein
MTREGRVPSEAENGEGVIMSERFTRYVIIAVFVLVAIGLFFAPAWSEPLRRSGMPEQEVAAGALLARLPGGEKLFLPLKKTDVRLEVTAGIVTARVTQRFSNDTAHPLEAVYIFPLPSRAGVTGMELRVGDRLISSVVKEKEEARRTYEKARREGKKTALVEQERPNIFTTSVANFLPGETAAVTLTYMQPAEYRRGAYDVAFPMVVGRRYIPLKLNQRTDGSAAVAPAVEDAERLNPPLLLPSLDSGHRLTLTAEIYGLAIDQVVSNTHAIEVHRPGRGSQSATVTLARGEVVPDRDFAMSIYLSPNSEPAASFVASPGDDVSHGLLTVFPPTVEGGGKGESAPREVIFLIDTSGSMSGTSIGQARTGLGLCLEMLRREDRFTIVRFSNGYSSFTPDLREATPERLESARNYVLGLTAGGGTDMQKALQHVLTFPRRSGRMRLIVFLTDGAVGNEHSLMRLLDENLNGARLFAFAIGSAPNEYLVRKMAEIGRGQARFIRSHEDIGEVMADFFRTLKEPILTDLRLTWEDDGPGRGKEVRFFPDPPPDVYLDRPLQVSLRYPRELSARLVVRGKRNGREESYTFPLQEGAGRDHAAVEKLFGRAHIGDLMFRWIRGDDAEKAGLKEEIVEAGLRYQLLSRFTSRVAVEERVERAPDGRLVTVPVKVPLPRGWNPGAFFPTATNDWFFLLAGVLLMISGFILASGGRAGCGAGRVS